MRILCFNQDWFVSEWRELGHEVISCGMRADLDVRFDRPLIHINTILTQLIPDFKPDVMVYYDNSMPVMVSGLEDCEIPSIFYSVDTHHHIDEQKYTSFIFDETIIAQKDYIPVFEALGSYPKWFPLWASKVAYSSVEKDSGAVFVGTLNPRLNPDRVRFFDGLKKLIEIDCRMGEWWNLFPRSEIVINQTVKGDLNFRVFEGLVSGSMLLTERTQNGLFDLFKDKKHLVSYSKGNVEEAADLIKYYLSNKNIARQIGEAGRAEVIERHLPEHRASELLIMLKALRKRKSKKRFFSRMYLSLLLCKRLERTDTSLSAQAIIEAMKSAEYGLKDGEDLNEELALHAVVACHHYDKIIRSKSGFNLLNQLREAYPEFPMLGFATVRTLLNDGMIKDATKIANSISKSDTNMVFKASEDIISKVLAKMYEDQVEYIDNI